MHTHFILFNVTECGKTIPPGLGLLLFTLEYSEICLYLDIDLILHQLFSSLLYASSRIYLINPLLIEIVYNFFAIVINAGMNIFMYMGVCVSLNTFMTISV